MNIDSDVERSINSIKYRFFEPISVVQKSGDTVSLRYYLLDNNVPLIRAEAKDGWHHAVMVILPEDLVLKRDDLIYVNGIDDHLMKQNFSAKKGTCLLRRCGAIYDSGQVFDICDVKTFAKNYRLFPNNMPNPGLSSVWAKVREK